MLIATVVNGCIDCCASISAAFFEPCGDNRMKEQQCICPPFLTSSVYAIVTCDTETKQKLQNYSCNITFLTSFSSFQVLEHSSAYKVTVAFFHKPLKTAV